MLQKSFKATFSIPFFILGNPRSGTSLLRILLNHHEYTSFPPECGFIQWLFDKYRLKKMDELVEEFVDDLCQTKKIEGWHIEKQQLLDFLFEIEPKTYSSICASVYIYYGLRRKDNIIAWGDKNNYYIHHLQTLNIIYPNAKYIRIIRDPRDVFISYRNVNDLLSNSPYKPNLPYSADQIAIQWVENENKVDSFLSIEGLESIVIRYEDLILAPIDTLDKVLNFMMLDSAGKSIAKNYSDGKYFDEPDITIEWKKKTKSGVFDKENVGKFKKMLSSKENLTIEAIAKDVMEKYNYL